MGAQPMYKINLNPKITIISPQNNTKQPTLSQNIKLEKRFHKKVY